MKKPRVLIMENEERVCRLLDRIINRMGFESLSVNKYPDFKASYTDLKPDVVMLSLDIPGLDHAHLLHYLLEHDAGATVILLSNMDEDELSGIETLGQLSGLNMGGILHKPIYIDSVKSILKDVVQRNHRPAVKKSHLSGKRDHARLVTLRELSIEPESMLAEGIN